MNKLKDFLITVVIFTIILSPIWGYGVYVHNNPSSVAPKQLQVRLIEVKGVTPVSKPQLILHLNGTIDSGASTRVYKTLMSTERKIDRVIITSRGGYVTEGITIAKLLYELHVPVMANKYCMSACTFILSVGTDRELWRDAKVGFHSPHIRLWGLRIDREVGSPSYVAIYDVFKLRMSPEMAKRWIDLTFAIPGKDIFLIDYKQANEFNLKLKVR